MRLPEVQLPSFISLHEKGSLSRWGQPPERFPNQRKVSDAKRLLRENQFALFRASQAVDLAVVFDPDFIATASQ